MMKNNMVGTTLADRLGVTVHVSLLGMKIDRLFASYPSCTARVVEDWLLDVANARGCLVVQREDSPGTDFLPPPETEFSNEELVIGICMPQRLDCPQLLRLAGQLLSRGQLDIRRLVNLARRERAGLVLGEMARQALKVDPGHSAWVAISDAFPVNRKIRSPVIHWQRLAWPEMTDRGVNARKWVLVK